MADFDYIARDSLGERQEGRIDAEDLLQAGTILRERKWSILSLDHSKLEKSLLTLLNPLNYFLREQDLEMSFLQYSTLIQSGVNLHSS